MLVKEGIQVRSEKSHAAPLIYFFVSQRVVIGHVDPDKTFGGAGVGLLESHGIKVNVGVCEDEVQASLRPYLHHRHTGRPYVVVKMATSIDGAVSCADGTSQWITQVPLSLCTYSLHQPALDHAPPSIIITTTTSSSSSLALMQVLKCEWCGAEVVRQKRTARRP
jgi:hypothetical protein